MLERGLALGGDEGNCVVFDEDGPINTSLRFANEPVRHKALDAVGDLALIGSPIWGHLTVERGGHALHIALLEALRARPECWTWVAGETMPIAARAVVSPPLARYRRHGHRDPASRRRLAVRIRARPAPRRRQRRARRGRR